ncbi:MAG: ATP-dependent DNA helicase [Candidatus Staskawiczbacteria bacterium]|nr:ATP-dependent DNA helicase [Candidatus Staskawiczbacteria bacterium]
MALDLEKLNKEQKTAVLHGKGPMLIVAGAGTGKTTVIAQRIVNLIEKGLAKPEEILAVTFTEKAASEMEERVDKLLEFGYIDLWILTFHSFAEKVLRENALDIGLSPDFKILDSTSSWLLARQNLDKFDLNYYQTLGNPTKFIQALISHFSHCKDQEVYPEDYLEYVDNLKTRDDSPEDGETERIKEVANAFYAYQQILLENSCLDFGDLINYCLKLFKKRSLILKKYREKFKYILVDEFQDTNWSQYELIKLLASPENNLTVCADDDQAIYRFRGASFSNIVNFLNDFSKSKQVSLISNYRSCQSILDLSYKFIQANNPDRLECVNPVRNSSLASGISNGVNKINKKLVSNKTERGIIKHIHANTLDEEVGQTIKKILEILSAQGGPASGGKREPATFNDIAILVRANDSAIPFIKALERARIPYQFLASRGLYSKPIVLDLISYFKLLDNYHEGSAVYRILNLPFLEISDADVSAITQYCRKKTKSLFESLEELPLIPGISTKTQESVSFVLGLVKKHSQMAREKGVLEVLIAFLEDSGYLKYLIDNDEKAKIDLLNQFYKKVKNFEESSIEPVLKNFMEEMNLELESGEEGKLEFDPELGPEMVKVMTIHGAKGLEFKYVFLVNMVDKRFPTIARKDPIELPDALIKDIKPEGDIHLQEERRLCYVAMTRAKKELYFTSAEDYGGQRSKKLSRFLIEMGYRDEGSERDVTSSRGVRDKGRGLALARPSREFEARSNISRARVHSQYLPTHFSYSQLAAFSKCPLQYKFAFILKVPTRGKAVFSFGKTMHNTLHEFLRSANDNRPNQTQLFQSSQPACRQAGNYQNSNANLFTGLQKIFEKQWIDEWYETKKQKDEYYKLGKKIIKEFYKKEFGEKSLPADRQAPNILRINGQLALEMPFNLKVGEHTLYGVIDRIDDNGGEAVIIDYKTGQSKDKLDFDAKEQLLIYQIAAQEVLHLKPKQLSYYYLEDGKIASFLGSENDLRKQKEKMLDEIEKIKNSEFAPTPGWQCQYCDFKDICDHAQH